MEIQNKQKAQGKIAVVLHSNNHSKCIRVNSPIKIHRAAECPIIQKPTRDSFPSKDTHRLKMKGYKITFQASRNQKKEGIDLKASLKHSVQ